MAAIALPRAGAPPFPKWPNGGCTIQLHPMVECDSVRTPGIPCVAPQKPLVPFTLFALPMWLSTRSKWPPPRSLSARRSLGRRGFPLESAAARVYKKVGERVTTNVRVEDLDLPPSRSQQSPLRSGGRWAPSVPWRSTCDRHHNGVPGPHGRFCAPAVCNMGQPWPKPVFKKSAPTPNSLTLTVGRAWWWWWLAKSAAGTNQKTLSKWSRPRG